jgi:hypothetical protein
MKLTIIIYIALIVFSLVVGNDVSADDSLTCGDGAYIVSINDTMSEVKEKCGTPSNIKAWEIDRVIGDSTTDIPAEQAREHITERIKIEEWTYNFGPDRFIYYLRFENGVLKSIKTGDYGY